jgi:hypothetical protein
MARANHRVSSSIKSLRNAQSDSYLLFERHLLYQSTGGLERRLPQGARASGSWRGRNSVAQTVRDRGDGLGLSGRQGGHTRQSGGGGRAEDRYGGRYRKRVTHGVVYIKV